MPGPLLVAALTLHMLVLQRDRSGVDQSGLAMLLSGRVLGTIPAAVLLASLPLDSMKILLAAVVLAGAVMGLLHSGGHPTPGVLFGAGAASGFMATTAGLGGPPVALVYQRERVCVCAARSPPISSWGRCSRSPRWRGPDDSAQKKFDCPCF